MGAKTERQPKKDPVALVAHESLLLESRPKTCGFGEKSAAFSLTRLLDVRRTDEKSGWVRSERPPPVGESPDAVAQRHYDGFGYVGNAA